MGGDIMSNGAATAGSNRLVDSDADLDPSSYSLEKFTLYETRARYYLVGRDKSKQHWRVLKIDRSEPADLSMCEDPVVYTQSECNILLKRIAEGNKSTGGLTLVSKAYGIVGIMKFLESYYMILVTKRRQVGTLCGHAIYAVEENQLIAVPHQSVQTDIALSKAELRYKKLLQGVDLTKDFFFSYTYRIMQSVQRNVLTKDDDHMPYENMFVWNAFLTRDIRQRLNNTRWTIPLIHGFFEQKKDGDWTISTQVNTNLDMEILPDPFGHFFRAYTRFMQAKLSTFGRIFVITLISRRSRHFAGTRYLKRGVNDRGRVANDVETEQVVVDEESEIGSPSGQISSVVQVRGSIPLFWSQEASRLSPKPDIILQRFDPVYHATKLHFQDLANRYGNPIIILSLIKTVEKRPREMMLRREFANAVGYLNTILPKDSRLEFIHWDFHKFAKSKSANVLAILGGVASQALDLTGVYYSGKPFVSKRRTQQRRMSASSTDSMSGSISPLRDHRPTLDLEYNSASLDSSSGRIFRDEEKKRINKVNNKREPRFQSGVLRTNCIDCLDRTNVAQYAYGLAALGRQLYAVGLTDTPQLVLDGGVAAALMDLYHNMGDVLALQYGGSAAHNTVFPERQGKWKATTQSREILNSIKRYYSNTYTDGDKQDAINLFLGHFQPQEGKPALWELDSDYYLHVAGYGDEFPRDDKKLLENSGTEVVTPQQNINGAVSAVNQRQEDYHSMKLTSFDKLLQVTCGSLKNVRMYGESEPRNRLFGAANGTAPDAAEVQLMSPNWLFGQRKQDQQSCADTAQSTPPKKPEDQMRQEFGELDWLSASGPYAEEELYNRYLKQVSSDFDAWYGTGLLPGSVEESDANQHYIQCCQGPDLNLVDLDMSKGIDYTNAVAEVAEGLGDEMVKWAMESALDQFQDIGGDPCTILPKTIP